MTTIPNIEYVRARYSFDPETGILTRIWGSCPNTKPGPVTFLHPSGYIMCEINYAKHGVHRVGWFLTYGVWPAGHIDHINGIKTDNRLRNLRAVDQSRNQWNGVLRRDNTSGYKGVYKTKTGRFGALIKQFNQRFHLGTFDTAVEAHEAYCAEAARRFGEYANSGFGPLKQEIAS